ncbi:MAG TPA: GNAT family N-acetyltransferase [Chitinophagaceae bacterium]|nr:GNAT family N-acetyltransferase [Chitinophagaceae bacterium]
MITYTTSKTEKELSDILDLQKMNLALNLSESEIRSQGFVTVSHSFQDIKKLNAYEQHVIIKDKEKIVGYLLAMTKHSRNDIPVLVPMFELFDRIEYKKKLISAYNYIVVGQVCIHKEYRGLGLLDQCYAAYKNFFKEKYDFAITEIATSNIRSIRAHKRIGFIEILKYTDQSNTEWSVVVWDWK